MLLQPLPAEVEAPVLRSYVRRICCLKPDAGLHVSAPGCEATFMWCHSPTPRLGWQLTQPLVMS